MRLILIQLMLFLLLFGCKSTPEIRRSYDSEVNNLALFLAGLPVAQESKYHFLTQKSHYEKHVAKMQAFREKLFTNHLDAMRAWATQNLPDEKPGTVLYLLSGADVTNLLTLFPNENEYVMMAMQKTGRLPDLLAMSDSEIARGLSDIRYTINDIASRNYFRSAVLYKSDRKRAMQGMLPVLLVFLATLQKEILQVEYSELDNAGHLVVASDSAAQGVRVLFRDAGGERSLVYLQEKLRPDTIMHQEPIALFFHSYSKVKLIFKAAIYLFHEKKFENFATYLVAKANFVIQDDTGIPLKFFEKTQWQFYPHGKYTRTPKLNDLKKYPVQQDLKELFADNLDPLPFDFGYGSWKGKGYSNLLLLKRKAKP